MRNSVEIGKILKNIRQKKKMTVTEFADRVGINKSTVSRYENGSRKIPMEDIAKFASVLGVTPQELLLDNVQHEKPKTKIETIAAHIDDDVTEEQMKEILNFIEFIKNK